MSDSDEESQMRQLELGDVVVTASPGSACGLGRCNWRLAVEKRFEGSVVAGTVVDAGHPVAVAYDAASLVVG